MADDTRQSPTPTQGGAREKSKGLRVPPHNLDAERALLGAIMLRPDSMHDVSILIVPDSFYAGKHGDIYRAILDLFSKGNPVDLVSISHLLTERGSLDRVGGASYITELVDAVPAAGNAQYYAELVSQKHLLRNLIRAADEIAELGFSNPEDVDAILDTAEKRIYQITQSPTSQKFISIRETLGEAWGRLEKLHASKEEIRGVKSGFPALDNMLAGFQKSDLIILAARPSMGKSTFALDITRNAAINHGAKVAFFSLEMSSQSLVDRMLAAEAKVDAWKLRTGKLSSDNEFALVQEALGRLSEAPIYFDDQPGTNILKMRSSARRLKNEHGLDLIIVDYLQLMMPTQSRGSDSMVQQVTEISRSLKNLARELDVPVIALSQLSRAVEQRGGKPRLSDLRDSGSIEQDADIVMFIHRDDKLNPNSDKPNIAEIMIEKHRNGPTGYIELYFDAKRTTFLSLDTNNAFQGATSGGGDEDF
ncbi:replicative DNA helicase [Patescibacteria group bacterium]|nr:replicative DNA helicase [Patescibacteria group bacterium]